MFVIIPLNNNCEEHARYIFERLKNMNIYCVLDDNYRDSLVSRYLNYNCRVILIRYNEVNDNTITIRNHNNQTVSISMNSFFQNINEYN